MSSLTPLVRSARTGQYRWRLRAPGLDVTIRCDTAGRKAAERAALPYLAAHTTTGRGTVAELVADWLALAERDRSPSTLIGYRRHAARIEARFGTRRASTVTAADVDRWYTELLAAGMSIASLHHVHRVLSAVLNFGFRHGRLDGVETRRVTLPAYRTPDIRPPDPVVLARIWAQLPMRAWGRAVRLLIATGMRRGEVCALKWEDVDLGAKVLTVRSSVVESGHDLIVKSPKGKRSRTITLSTAAFNVLIASVDGTGGYVFSLGAGDGLPMRPSWLSSQWERWRWRHGAQGVRLHDLRHWYATSALEAGAPLASVAAQLGHAQTSTTLNIYASRTDAGRRQVADAIDQALGVDSSAPVIPGG